jgi:hypothetical protein
LVTALAESIGKIGLRHPVSIRLVDGEAVLIAGQHRVEACRIAGIQFVECAIFDGGEADAKLWEISENLHRSELSVLERSEHIAEWVRLVDAKAQLAPSEKMHTGGRASQGINAATRELGIDRTEAPATVKTG